MFKCNHCKNEYNSFNGLARHSTHAHNVPRVELYMLVNNIPSIPKCKCGCGQEVKFQSSKFAEYIQGHIARANGGFYSEKGAKKSGETRKKRFASGEITQWNKGKQYTDEQLKVYQAAAAKPERKEKISKALKGKKKSPEHVAKIKADRQKYWSDRTHRLEQRERRMQYIINNGLGYSSKLELVFKEILDTLGIKYIEQFYARDIKALYDFKIKNKKILIEVDGDYWHCNPNLEKFKTPTKQWHFDNIARDEIKNKWAEENGYKLIRFWENDIVNNRLACIEQLIGVLK
jgi:G:T-mismatch repair DNA endonuclease (very short patch repair protein)